MFHKLCAFQKALGCKKDQFWVALLIACQLKNDESQLITCLIKKIEHLPIFDIIPNLDEH